MNAVRDTVTMLLDAEDPAEFLRTYKQKHWRRYEFSRSHGSSLDVRRFDISGMYHYIGIITQPMGSTNEWVVYEVAPRTFYDDRTNMVKRVRDAYIPDEKRTFPTKEAAADRLWEIYQMEDYL